MHGANWQARDVQLLREAGRANGSGGSKYNVNPLRTLRFTKDIRMIFPTALSSYKCP
jgi:hypothetical protein